MTEIELHQPQAALPLAAQMDYAKAVATASMLPQNYRNKPADIMLAVGLGQSMGLSPAESLYRISVIQGKPTAGAELIAANVRKAGHRLRVKGDDQSCTATIIRADDPDYEFEVTRDMAWAEKMGLAKNDNYRKQSGTMLQWRAITAVARLACPEALYGVAYTSDEVGDFAPEPSQTGGLAAALDTQPAGARLPYVAADVEVPEAAQESPLLNTSSNLAKRMFATFNDAGITEKNERLAYVSDVVGREITSSTEMSEADASAVLDALKADQDKDAAREEPPAEPTLDGEPAGRGDNR